MNGSLSGALYSAPLLSKSIPQKSSGSIKIEEKSHPIHTAFFVEGEDQDFIYATDTSGFFITFSTPKKEGIEKTSYIYKDQTIDTVSLDGLSFSDLGNTVRYNLNNIPAIGLGEKKYTINGSIQTPKPKSTLQVNSQEWPISSLFVEDVLKNNYLIRSLTLRSNNDNFEILDIYIKNKSIAGVKYMNTKNTINASCGLATLQTCNGISLSNQYDTITFNQTKIGNHTLNGTIDINVR